MRTMILLFALPIITFAAALAPTATAWAEETELEEVVVTAERSPQNLTDTARAVETVGERQILDRIGRSVPESLRQVAGVSVQRTNLGGGSPFIRGLVGNQVLILVDGIRLNNSTARGGPNQYLNTIDPLFVERIEVVRGPGSVLYGSDALGGTINVITRRRTNFDDVVGIDGRLMSRATTAEREITNHLDLEANGGGLVGLTFSGNFRQFGDVDPGGSQPLQARYGYEEQDFAGNVDFHLKSNLVWQFSAQHVNLDNVPNYDPDNPKNRFEPQRRDMFYSRLLWTDIATGLDAVSAFASYHQQLEGREKIKADDLTLETRDLDVVHTYAGGLQLESGVGDWLSFIYGGEVYRDFVASDRKTRRTDGSDEQDVESQFPDASTYLSAAGYFEVRFTPWKWLKLVPGARYSHFAPFAQIDDPSLGEITIDDPFGEVTWAVHSLWKPHTAHGIVLGASRGFRAPSLDELTKLGSEDGRYDVPNPDLEPEQMTQYEVGYRVNYSRVSGSAFAYYSDIANLITRKPTAYNGQRYIGEDQVNRNENVGEATIWGSELQLRIVMLPDVLRGGLAGAYTWGQNETDDEPIRRIPPPTGNAYLRAFWPSQLAWFEVAGDFAGKQERLSQGDKDDGRIGPDGTDGFGVMNLRSGFLAGDFFELQFAVENVFDEPYKTHGSGLLEPGRNFKAQLSYVF